MLEALTTIAALLHKYGPRHADVVEALLAALAARDPNFAIDVCADALWGERGLWDTGPQVLQRPQHDDTTCRHDELSYRRAFLTLAEAIEAKDWGAGTQRTQVRAVAETFRAWEREGL